MRLAAVRIVTADEAALARFYEAVTGVAPVGSDEYVELRSAGATLSISSAAAARLCGGGAAAPSTNRSLILDFEVQDVDAERVRLEEVVVDWVVEPTTQPWGNRSMLFRDPDGNLVNLFARARDFANGVKSVFGRRALPVSRQARTRNEAEAEAEHASGLGDGHGNEQGTRSRS